MAPPPRRPRCDAPPPEAPPSTTDGRVGQLLFGRFRVLGRLGEGAMGDVYRAEQRVGPLRREVAIKVLRPEMSDDRSLRTRFLREAAVMTRLEHPNNVRVFDVGELEDGCLALVMELIEGETLRERLARRPLPAKEALAVGRGLLAALQEAHALGIVHRDVKPDNVMLVRRPDGGLRVKLLDFGVALDPNDARPLTGHGQLVGTPPYMSPEQLMGRALDARSDLYAVAVTLHEALCGTHPLGQSSSVLGWMSLHLDAEPAPLDAPGLPDAARAVLRCAMAKARENRPRDAREMARSLCDVGERAPSPLPCPRRVDRRIARLRAKTSPSTRSNRPSFPLDAHPHPVVPEDPPRVPLRAPFAAPLLLAAAVLLVCAAAFAGLLRGTDGAPRETRAAAAARAPAPSSIGLTPAAGASPEDSPG